MSLTEAQRPYKSTAADRIAQTEARLGRRIWAARELPDDLARALWWKMRHWYFERAIEDAADNDSAFNRAFDQFAEAENAHDLLIREMWLRRRLDLEARAWAALGSIGTAMAPDRETERAW